MISHADKFFSDNDSQRITRTVNTWKVFKVFGRRFGYSKDTVTVWSGWREWGRGMIGGKNKWKEKGRGDILRAFVEYRARVIVGWSKNHSRRIGRNSHPCHDRRCYTVFLTRDLRVVSHQRQWNNLILIVVYADGGEQLKRRRHKR